MNKDKLFFYSDEVKIDINNLNNEQQALYDELSRRLDEKYNLLEEDNLTR